VKIYFDTNVLVAAALENHPHHVAAEAAPRKVHSREFEGWISAHSVTEFYGDDAGAADPAGLPQRRLADSGTKRLSPFRSGQLFGRGVPGRGCDTARGSAAPADGSTMRSIWRLLAKPVAGRSTLSICGTFANSHPN
jgi:hypothetical protein